MHLHMCAEAPAGDIRVQVAGPLHQRVETRTSHIRRRGTVETGVLSVQLARRGEHWRIAQLHLEPAR